LPTNSIQQMAQRFGMSARFPQWQNWLKGAKPYWTPPPVPVAPTPTAATQQGGGGSQSSGGGSEGGSGDGFAQPGNPGGAWGNDNGASVSDAAPCAV
jgi:hypothetical protein